MVEDGLRWIDLGAARDLSGRRLSRQTVAGTDVVLCWLNGQPYAYRNLCTHLHLPLDGGRIIGGQLLCPHHGACFDVRTGAALSGPAVRPLCVIPLKLEGGHLFCDLSGIDREDHAACATHIPSSKLRPGP